MYCGHIVERSAHASHRTLHAAFTGGAACPECGLDPATIVDGEAIGLVEEPPVKAKTMVRAPSKPTRAQREARIRELEAQLQDKSKNDQ
jgi:hypothetical protein